MKKKQDYVFSPRGKWRKILLIMKLKLFILLCCVQTVNATAFSQEQKLNVAFDNELLVKVIDYLQDQTGLQFFYLDKSVSASDRVSVKMKQATLPEILDKVLKGNGYGYEILDGVVIIKPMKGNEPEKKSVRVKGFVYDMAKQPMPGVTVKVVGVAVGTSTNAKGWFVMDLPLQKGALEFSFIGFKKEQVEFTEKTDTLRIVMEEDVSDLDEVVVRAYGTQNKREMISAISSVKAEEMKELPAASIVSMLQGRLAGVNIVNQSGAPGSAAMVAIRGYNSLFTDLADGKVTDAAGNNGQPLYVVDGVPMFSFVSPVTGSNALADLDPSMIESVEVLKDAAAASIYGSRAGNGVILITTKKGKEGTSSFAANVSYTISDLMETSVQTGGRMERWMAIIFKRNQVSRYSERIPGTYNYNYYIPTSYTDEDAFQKYGTYDAFWKSGEDYINIEKPLQDSLNPFYNNCTNWWNYAFRTGKVLNANIQASGGNQKFQYMVGAGFYKEKGIMLNSNYSRVNLISNMTVKPIEELQVDSRVYLAYMDRSVNVNGMHNGRYEGMTVNPRGQSTLESAEGIVGDKWLEMMNGTVTRSDDYRLMAGLTLRYEPLKGLTFSANANVDYAQSNMNQFTPSYLSSLTGENQSSGMISRSVALSTEELMNYKKSFNERHNLDLLLGFNAMKNQTFDISGWGKGMATDNIYYYNSKSNPETVDYGNANNPNVHSLRNYDSSFKEKTLISFFCRLGYNYNYRYLLEFMFRRDGSSTFGENNKWANFPSIAVGWNFAEESFIKNWIGHWMNRGKVRVSYGTSGQIFGNEYLAYGLLTNADGVNFNGNAGMAAADGISPDLTWEKSKQYDLGLDIDLLESRVQMKLDYYYKYSSSLIYAVPAPGDMYGYLEYIQNAMEVSNEGLELELTYEALRNTAVTWRTKLNASRNWNRFEKSYDNRDKAQLVIGQSLYQIYVYDDDGYYTSENEVPTYYKTTGEKTYLGGISTNKGVSGLVGTQKLRDLDSDGNINYALKDRYPAASPLPLVYGGWVNEIRWKNLDLNILFNYTLGRHIVNQNRATLSSGGTLYLDYRDIRFYGQSENPNYPRLGTEYNINVRSAIEKVNHVSLKQITLGYDFPKKWFTGRWKFSGARLFVTGENLFYLSNYSGLNPEVVDVYTGQDTGQAYPLPRKWTFGITLKL